MRHRYFIAHLLKGPVQEYHHTLVREIAEKFDLKVNKGYFPSHVTLKAPFEASEDELFEIKKILKEVVSRHVAPHFLVQGFGHFGRHIITLDIIHTVQTEDLHQALLQRLKTLAWLTWGKHEPIMHLHVTIAKNNIEAKFDDMWDYLKTQETPPFSCTLDNIALLRLENDAWVVDSTYELDAIVTPKR